MTPLEGFVAEVEREVAIRRQAYPKWKAAGKYPGAQLDKQLGGMEGAAKTLKWLASHQQFVKWAIANKQEIQVAMAYLETLKGTPEYQAIIEKFPGAKLDKPPTTGEGQ